MNISAEIPQDFSGVPEMNNLLSAFIGYGNDRGANDIEKLWRLFEDAVFGKDIKDDYDALNGQFLIKYNITFGLFWIRPDKYLALDGNNRANLESLGIANFRTSRFVPYQEYKGIMDRLDAKMQSGEIDCKNYAEFSLLAYTKNDGASTRDVPKKGEKNNPPKENYWWLVGNPNIWSLSKMKVGEEVDYHLRNENGHQRRIYQNFLDAKKGDIVIGYESTPTKQIVCLLEVSKANDGKIICFKKTENLPEPIDFSALKETSGLEDMEYMKNQQGTFFKVTVDEFDILMEMIRGGNPEPKKIEKEKYSKDDFLKEVCL